MALRTSERYFLLGASAINCWRPVPNPPTCYSLGRHLSATVLSTTRPTRREETTLSQSHVFVARKRRVRRTLSRAAQYDQLLLE